MNKEFYIKSRERVANLLPDNSALILFAGKDVRESEDQSYEFCVNRNFYYLTGVNEQNDILVMLKKDNKIDTMIFINEYDELFAKWNGRKMFPEEITNISGIDNIRYLKAFNDFLNEIKDSYSLFLDVKPNLFDEPLGQEQKLVKEFDLTVTDCHDLIAKCRMVKQPEEIDEIKKAIHVTWQGIKALMDNIKPGLYEYQVESYFDQQIKFNGASGIAFKTIIKNSSALSIELGTINAYTNAIKSTMAKYITPVFL